MARESADRDDLMAEAVTLLPRVEFVIRDPALEIVAGRRTDGRWSVFFGGDPVYHFDAQHRLRRAFVEGVLYRSQGTTLARLTRQESSAQTVLLRHDLADDELKIFWLTLRRHLQFIADAWSQWQILMRSTIPPDAEYLPELVSAINHVLNTGGALSPAITKR